jgi:hypothetical protein
MNEDQNERADHLLCSHADRLDCELASTHVEEILKVGAKQVDYQDIMEPFLTEMVHLGDTGCKWHVRSACQQCEGQWRQQRTGAIQSPV